MTPHPTAAVPLKAGFDFMKPLLFALLLLPVLGNPAAAQSSMPQVGDSCSQQGAFVGNYIDGGSDDGNLMVCDGTSWVSFLTFNEDKTAAAQGEFQVGTTTGLVCDSGSAGAMRFDDGKGCMSFCGGESWSCLAIGDPCSFSPDPGTVCSDGTVYAGLSPDGDVPMYVTPCDAHQYWNGSSCADLTGHWSGAGSGAITDYGTGDGIAWNNGTSNWTLTGYTNYETGKANTAGLADLSDAGSPYQAARYCDRLTAYGHSDWYLPARNELQSVYLNEDEIGNFDTSGTDYWSSSGNSTAHAWMQRFSDGYQNNYFRTTTNAVRCARR